MLGKQAGSAVYHSRLTPYTSLLSPCIDSEIRKYIAVPFSFSYNMELLFDYLLIHF